MAKNEQNEEQGKKNHTRLMDRLNASQKYEEDQRKTWKKVLQVLDFKREVTTGSDTVTTKVKYPLLWSAYDNYLSELSTVPPQTIIEADGKEDLVKKVFWRGVLEYRKRKLRIEDLKEEFVQSFITVGKSVYKVGRVVETAKGKKEAKGKEGETLVEEEVEAITRNETFVSVVDPRRFWVSPETRYTGPILGEECPYCIEEMIKSPEYLEERYGIEVREDEKEVISPDEFTDDKTKNAPSGDNSDDMKRVRLYAYYGDWTINGKLHHNCEVLFTTKRKIQERAIPYDHKKKPYIMGLNFRKFFQPIARGALDAVLDLDQEYNEHMNRLRTILRRTASPKWVKLKGTVVDEAALLNPDVGLIVEESQVNAFRPLEGPRVDPALFEKATAVEQLFQLLTGIVYGSTAIKEAGTATGQGIVEKGADTKTSRMSKILERCQEELEIMMLQLEQQYAAEDPTDIRITGADVVQMIKNKKTLHKASMDIWQRKQDMAQQPQIDPATGQPMPQEPTEPEPPPIDEYERFQISEDGRAIITSYNKEDIQGEFELTVISQSSNRSNKAVQAQQILLALDKAAAEPSIRAGLWKRLFTNYNWEEMMEAINAKPMQAAAPALPGGQPGMAPPTPAGMQGAINREATATV